MIILFLLRTTTVLRSNKKTCRLPLVASRFAAIVTKPRSIDPTFSLRQAAPITNGDHIVRYEMRFTKLTGPQGIRPASQLGQIGGEYTESVCSVESCVGFQGHFFTPFLWGLAKKGCRLRDETRELDLAGEGFTSSAHHGNRN